MTGEPFQSNHFVLLHFFFSNLAETKISILCTLQQRSKKWLLFYQRKITKSLFFAVLKMHEFPKSFLNGQRKCKPCLWCYILLWKKSMHTIKGCNLLKNYFKLEIFFLFQKLRILEINWETSTIKPLGMFLHTIHCEHPTQTYTLGYVSPHCEHPTQTSKSSGLV